MRLITVFLFSIAILFSGTQSTSGQTINLLAGNTLNGAVNGTLLGGATMALNNDTDFRPIQVGVGLGTLYGLGVGAYDVAQSGGQQLLVSGLFNDGDNSSIIVLLDTFYGAAAGAIIATSVMLITDEPLLDGLKYGTATGAWIGFGVGVIDSFALSQRRTPTSSAMKNAPDNSANGLVGIQFNEQTSVGFVSPSVISTYRSGSLGLSKNITPTVDVLNLKVNF